MDRDYFPKLNKWDLIGRLDPLLHPNGAYVQDPRDNKIKIPLEVLTKDRNTPWVHIKQSNDRRCKIYQDVFAGCLNCLPQRCVNCWKVVFRPQSLKDMLNLIPLMEHLADKHDFNCKLGSEERPWTSGVYGKWGLWGCYFYNNSKEDGFYCYETVLNAIAQNDDLKYLLDDLDEDGYSARLILKRGCTEFELTKFGDSKYWIWTDEAKEWERIVGEVIEKQDMSQVQGRKLRNHVIKRWFQHAHHAGDPTVKEFNEGTMLWRSTRYYHKELPKKNGGRK